jgi:YhcH/YjgK/YiaL family protein
MIYDSVENVDCFCEEDDPIYRAVQFGCKFNMLLPDGRYEIDGDNIFAMVQSATTVEAKSKNFEAHQQYVDVQMVLQGCERQDVVLLNKENI